MTHKSIFFGGRLHFFIFAICSPLLGQDFQSTDRGQLDGSGKNQMRVSYSWRSVKIPQFVTNIHIPTQQDPTTKRRPSQMTGRVEMTWNKSTKTYDPFVCNNCATEEIHGWSMLVPIYTMFSFFLQRCGTWLPNTCFFRWILWRWDVGGWQVGSGDVLWMAIMGSHRNWWLRTGGQFPVHQSCVTWTYTPAFLCLVTSEVFVQLEKEDVKTCFFSALLLGLYFQISMECERSGTQIHLPQGERLSISWEQCTDVSREMMITHLKDWLW